MKERPIIDLRDAGCLHRSKHLAVVIFANGKKHVTHYCPDCEQRSQWYSKAELVGVEVGILEVVQDNRNGVVPAPPCEVCASADGVELHHWAPQSLEQHFTAYTSWPTAWLCLKCHQEWHRAVTPDLVAHAMTLEELGARRSTTIHELAELVRAKLAARRPKVLV